MEGCNGHTAWLFPQSRAKADPVLHSRAQEEHSIKHLLVTHATRVTEGILQEVEVPLKWALGFYVVLKEGWSQAERTEHVSRPQMMGTGSFTAQESLVAAQPTPPCHQHRGAAPQKHSEINQTPYNAPRSHRDSP